MALETYTITNFGGLNEVDAPDDVGIENATAIEDVCWAKSSTGVLQSRASFSEYTSTAESAGFQAVGKFAGGANAYCYVGYRSGILEGYSGATGTSVTTQVVTGDKYRSFVNYGTPSATYMFISDPGDYPDRYDGTNFSSRTNLPRARWLAVQPSDNRLVAANTTTGAYGPGGATSSPSHVWFSNPGDPETWGANNYVQLTPGDGEGIAAITTWNNQIFVFKRSTLFIFYGNSTDSGGNPVFNYRTVSLAGSRLAHRTAATAFVGTAPEGVYFSTGDDLCLTTGDAPVRLAQTIAPTFSDDSGVSCAGRYTVLGTGAIPYVWDSVAQEWTRWSMGLVGNIAEGADPTVAGVFGTNSLTERLYYLSTEAGGSGEAGYWTSGLSNLGYESEKRLKYIDVWGTGSISLSVASNFGSPADATTLTLGTDPAIDRARYTTAAVGHLFGIKIASVGTGAWKVHRITLHFEPSATRQHDRT